MTPIKYSNNLWETGRYPIAASIKNCIQDVYDSRNVAFKRLEKDILMKYCANWFLLEKPTFLKNTVGQLGFFDYPFFQSRIGPTAHSTSMRDLSFPVSFYQTFLLPLRYNFMIVSRSSLVFSSIAQSINVPEKSVSITSMN